uniref:Transposase n=1 Tax=Ascaris lumbricoides TaxID=6252 RepID=A0A0M3HX74_ASCLU
MRVQRSAPFAFEESGRLFTDCIKFIVQSQLVEKSIEIMLAEVGREKKLPNGYASTHLYQITASWERKTKDRG